jgi:nitroreductase
MSSAISDTALDQLFRSARTVNGFKPEAVSDDTVHALYELLKWGPTAFNCQPARYVFLHSMAAKERLLPALSPGNVDKTRNAPLSVIVAYDQRFFEHLPTQFPAYDAKPIYEASPTLANEAAFRNGTLQGAYLILAARALGLDCGPMSGFDAGAVNREFFAGTSYQANFLCNIGYGDPASPYPRGPRLAFDEVAQIL